jgi:hypothetical protein
MCSLNGFEILYKSEEPLLGRLVLFKIHFVSKLINVKHGTRKKFKIDATFVVVFILNQFMLLVFLCVHSFYFTLHFALKDYCFTMHCF